MAMTGGLRRQGGIVLTIAGCLLTFAGLAEAQTLSIVPSYDSEVTDEIASGPRSAIYDIAENRLHVQKAVMALTMGNL